MRPAHFALVLFVLSFLLLSFSSTSSSLNIISSNIDPCPGCFYTYIAPRLAETKDPNTGAVTQSVEALLYSSITYYYQSTGIVEASWRAAKSGNNLFDISIFVADPATPDTKVELTVLPGKTLNFYMLTYVRDPVTYVVTETKTPIPACTGLVTGSDPADPLTYGIAKCDLPALPQLTCTPILAEYAGEKDFSTGQSYYASTSSIDVCGDFTIPLGTLDAVRCLPIFILFGLLAGAMYAAGRNPTALFDISTPRLPRPKPYGMRRMSFGTGGTLQRLALNKQLRLSQNLQNRSIRKLANDLKKSGINAAEIDALLSHMRAWERPTNHEIAAALRIMATRGCGSEEALRRVKEISALANTRATKEGFGKDDIRREMLVNNNLRRVVHIGEEGQRGAWATSGAKLQHQATFRALHDALWHDENARRALAANALAYGQVNWFNMRYAGGVAGGALDNAAGSNRFKKWANEAFNIGPRLSDKGFLGAMTVGVFGRARLVGDLMVKFGKDGVPIMLGLKKSKANVGNLYDAQEALRKGLEDHADSVAVLMALRKRYRTLSDDDLKTTLFGPNSRKALETDSGRNRFEFIKALNNKFNSNPALETTVENKMVVLRKLFKDGFDAIDRLTDKKQKDAETKKLYDSAKKIYNDLSELTAVKFSYAGVRGNAITMKQSFLDSPLHETEFNRLTYDVVFKYKLRELGLFAVEHGVIAEADYKAAWGDVSAPGRLAKLYREYMLAESETIRTQRKIELEGEMAKLLKSVRTRLNPDSVDEKADPSKLSGAALENYLLKKRLSSLMGFDHESISKFANGNGTATIAGKRIGLLDTEGILGVKGQDGLQKYILAISASLIYNIDPAKQREMENKELKDKTTHELARMMVQNAKEGGAKQVFEDVALALGASKADAQKWMQKARSGATLDLEVDKMVREKMVEAFMLRRRNGYIDEVRQALVEGLGREEWAQGVAGLREQVRFVGGEMVDFGDLSKRLDRDAMALGAMQARGMQSGAKVTVSDLAKGVWISTPDEGFIPFEHSVMNDGRGNLRFALNDGKEGLVTNDSKSNSRFMVGGSDKILFGKLKITEGTGTEAGTVQVQEVGGLKRALGNRLDAVFFSTFDTFNDRMSEAKSLLKYNKQAARTMEHGPVATLGIYTTKSATGAFAGEYSMLTEARQRLDDEIQDRVKKLGASEQGYKAGKRAADFEDEKRKLRDMYKQMEDLDKQMRSADEARYHDAFFKFARHFREIDDSLTVSKTQRALSSTWGGSAYVDMLHNIGMAMPWTPWHGVRGRIPLGTPLSVALQPGWMIGKYFAERLRPYALLGSGMPAYNDVQEHSQKMQWKKAIMSIIPISPESVKYWDFKRMDLRDPKYYKAVDTDGDIIGSVGYEIMQNLKQQKKTLDAAVLEAERQKNAVEAARLTRAAAQQQQNIDDEFRRLQHGFYREIDYEATAAAPPGTATQFKDEYRSIFLKDKGSGDHIAVDSEGKLSLEALRNPNIESDASTIRLISPTYHRSIIGTAPIDTVGDHFMTFGNIVSRSPLTAWLAKIPINASYYDFDAYEPGDDRHGRSGFIGTHNSYHQPVGGVYGLAAAVLPIPGVGPLLAQAVSQIPILGSAPLGLDPAIWGAKAMYTGEYVEKGLTGASHMWSKWNMTYEQLPLYRMGAAQPVAGVTYFSPYKYMDPNLVMNLTPQYKYLVEPHENITAYPHLADEIARDMNITEQMYQRNNELSFFQRWSRAQLVGTIPIVGLMQSVPMGLNMLGFEKESHILRNALEQHFPLLNIWYNVPKAKTTTIEQHIMSTHMYIVCGGCGLQTKAGQFCSNCGKFAVRA
ncbi:MAG: hypothetical protein Q7T16_00340 [Candidatus Burarchaeum sp.]|nr:hypothetical protein [Candidatus Burarchaeum sp.]MDO8339087.1 hypothetical protein [Candidatus Burarchaeum sp.]